MVDGHSIIFHKARKTKLSTKEMKDQGNEPKTCQKIVGYDGIYGPSCKICPPDHLQDAEKKQGLRRRAPPAECGIHIQDQMNDTEN